MLRKILHSAMALTLGAGLAVSSVGSAEAHGRGAGVAVGLAAGLIGLGILGATAHAGPRYYADDRCYKGRERCGWRDRHCFVNSYGDEVCRGGRYTCWRPTYCD